MDALCNLRRGGGSYKSGKRQKEMERGNDNTVVLSLGRCDLALGHTRLVIWL